MTRRRRINAEQRLEIYLRQDGLCACGCGKPLDGTQEYDHVIELALGGADDIGNMQALLPACHKRKSAERLAMTRKADRQKRYHETGRSSGKAQVRKIRSQGFRKDVRRRMDGTVERR